MSNPWFRMYSDFIFDEVIEFLAFEDQRHFVFLLCMKNAGLLDKEYPKDGMLDRVVARRLGLVGEVFDNAKKRLMEVGLIDVNWQPINWNKRQFISDSDNSHAARQRKYRERKKNVTRDVTRDVTVTVLDTDTDTDTEKSNAVSASIDQSKKSEKKRATPVPKDFEVTPEMFDWVIGKGMPETKVRPETEAFINNHKAKGNVFVDWNAAWRTWMIKSVGYAEQRR